MCIPEIPELTLRFRSLSEQGWFYPSFGLLVLTALLPSLGRFSFGCCWGCVPMPLTSKPRGGRTGRLGERPPVILSYDNRKGLLVLSALVVLSLVNGVKKVENLCNGRVYKTHHKNSIRVPEMAHKMINVLQYFYQSDV